MTNVIDFPLAEERETAYPPHLFPGTRRRVALLLETSDEARLAGFDPLADALLIEARKEVEALAARIAA